MAASASYTVNGDAVDGAMDVAASSTVNLALVSSVGVRTVSWSVVGNHSPDATNPTITPAGSPSGATASFAMPSGSSQAYLVQCQVNAGVDELNRPVSAQTFRAVIGVPNDASRIPFAAGETTERSTTHGWIEELNGISSGAGARISLCAYTFATSTSDADPGEGTFRLNNASMPSSTFIYVADEELGQLDFSAPLQSLGTGDFVVVQQPETGGAKFLFQLTGAAVDGFGAYTKLPVTVLSTYGGVNFDAGARCEWSFIKG